MVLQLKLKTKTSKIHISTAFQPWTGYWVKDKVHIYGTLNIRKEEI